MADEDRTQGLFAKKVLLKDIDLAVNGVHQRQQGAFQRIPRQPDAVDVIGGCHRDFGVFGLRQVFQQGRQAVIKGLFGVGIVKGIETGAADEFIGNGLHPGGPQAVQTETIDGRVTQDGRGAAAVQHGQNGAVQVEIEVQQDFRRGILWKCGQGMGDKSVDRNGQGLHDAGQQFQLRRAIRIRHGHQDVPVHGGQLLPDGFQMGVGQVGMGPPRIGRVLQGRAGQLVPEVVVGLARHLAAAFFRGDADLEVPRFDDGKTRTGQGACLNFQEHFIGSGCQDARIVQCQSDHTPPASIGRVCNRRVSFSSQ